MTQTSSVESSETVAPQTDTLPWEQRDDETAPAFEAFAVYRDLGPERSQTMTARRLGKSRQLLGKWSVRHDWAARVREYDADVDAERRAAHLADRLKSDDQHFQLGERMLNRVRREVQRLEESDEPIPPAYLAALAKAGSYLQRLGLGEATSISESKQTRVESLDLDLSDLKG